MADFDPYYEWLGISPEERPINFYRLFNLSDFESKPNVISNAADRQMMYVRSLQNGPHSAESQRILNELAKARVILLNPDKKKEYDARLRKEQFDRAVPLPPTVNPLKRPEPLVQSVPKRPEPPVQSAPKRPEPSIQSAPKRPEPSIQSAPKRPEPSVQSAPKRPEPSVQSAPNRPEPSVQSAPKRPEPSIQSAPKRPEPSIQSAPKRPKASIPSTPIFPEFPNQPSDFSPNIQNGFDDVPFNPQWSNLKQTLEIKKKIPVWKITSELDKQEFKTQKREYIISNFCYKSVWIKLTNYNEDILPSITLDYLDYLKLCLSPSHIIIKSPEKDWTYSYKEISFKTEKVYYLSDFKLANNIARGIDWTWEHCNKNGDRDRRYKKNDKKAILEFFKIEITFPEGDWVSFLLGDEDIAKLIVSILLQKEDTSIQFEPTDLTEEFAGFKVNNFESRFDQSKKKPWETSSYSVNPLQSDFLNFQTKKPNFKFQEKKKDKNEQDDFGCCSGCLIIIFILVILLMIL